MQLVALCLVLFPLLEDFEGFLLNRRLAGAVAHLCELLLVGAQFGVELGELDIEAFYPRVDLDLLRYGQHMAVRIAYIGDGAAERRLGRVTLRSEQAVHSGGISRKIYGENPKDNYAACSRQGDVECVVQAALASVG